MFSSVEFGLRTKNHLQLYLGNFTKTNLLAKIKKT
jgi:hypothetical protein